ncbi:S41 family peptidase [Bacillus kwashiorkori]|uniref:lmo1851 family serine protease n=1 Tax=Bacillus kwashiorkori TaxID=1522318 RepID=UPI00078095C7|nr:S41 family peptidase [Bacillus kwashiorkori]
MSKEEKDIENFSIENQSEDNGTDNKYIKIKKFRFIMMMFFLVFMTAGITIFVLSFGEDKPVEKITVRDRAEFMKLYDVFESIKGNYVDDIDENQLIEGAINGMVDAIGDPYSDYMTKEETNSFHDSINSSFEGIGAQVEEKEGKIVIVAPIKGSPAEKVGLRANDIILAVDGKSIQGMTATEAVTLIRGKKGTEVELLISRPGIDGNITVKITRDVIPIETVYSEMLKNKIGKVQITSFSNNTLTELQTHLNELKEKGMKALILDVRQNPGGLLEQAIYITSLFVPNGEVIYQMEYNDGKRERQLSGQKESFDLPLVLLVDGGSASASEILAGALKESAGVPIVGEKTFGKGTAQSAVDFNDGSSFKITTARWLTPNGNWIHEKGIEPDYQVSLPEYAYLPYINPELELKESMLSDPVKVVEKMLKALGYDPGKIDGFFDEKLSAAVKEFQKAEKLEETGVVTGDTTLSIMERLRENLIKNDPQVKKAIEVLKEKLEESKKD